MLVAMARVIILSDDPAMGRWDVSEWLHIRADRLRASPSVTSVEVHRLAASSSGASWCNWLVELAGPVADAIERDVTLTEMLGDLRVLGMRPQLLVVQDAG
jgi:hypothetical protein